MDISLQHLVHAQQARRLQFVAHLGRWVGDLPLRRDRRRELSGRLASLQEMPPHVATGPSPSNFGKICWMY